MRTIEELNTINVIFNILSRIQLETHFNKIKITCLRMITIIISNITV